MGVDGVRRIEVTERENPVFGGTEFGAVGPYERLHGTVFGELDPTHRLNAGIVNLDRAARNTHGNVEYQSDFRILKPLGLDRGNGCLVYDVPNRGNQPINLASIDAVLQHQVERTARERLAAPESTRGARPGLALDPADCELVLQQ